MATLMLDMYENIRSFLSFSKNSNIHIDGTAALVQARKQLPYDSEVSQCVLLGARGLILGRAVRDNEPMPEAVTELTEMTGGAKKSPGHTLDDVHISLLEVQKLAKGVKGIDGGIIEILQKVIEVDERYLSWSKTLPEHWIPLRLSSEQVDEDIKKAGFYGGYCTIFRSLFIADIVNGQAMARIQTQEILLDCLKVLQKYRDSLPLGDRRRLDLDIAIDIEAMEESAISTIQSLVDAVCASVPFHLGDKVDYRRIDNLAVKYPRAEGWEVPEDHYVTAAAQGGWFLCSKVLTLMKLEKGVREGQKEWMRGQFDRVVRIYGIKVGGGRAD
ncbi:hypothetical protein ABW19_dt0210320 [Dactylella cylindrospora]|nr:hypothetical protein ABW19_dt0210320 [Dactylella cylindrospora]